MIIQIDTYDPQVIEFAQAYLDYYSGQIEPDHRLANSNWRKNLNEGELDSTPLGIGFGYDLSRFNKEAYKQSRKDSRRRYDFPDFDGEAILIFRRYLNKYNQRYEKEKKIKEEKEAIIGKLYRELGTDGILFQRKPHEKSMMTKSNSGGRKIRRRVCCIHRTRRTRRGSKTTRKN